jgi:FMN phosphatase YigB (HAD superfamily)
LKNKPVIITDVDGVLLDFLMAFAIYLEEENYCINHIKPLINTNKYMTFEDMINVDCERKIEEIKNKFFQSDRISKFPVFQNESIEHLKTLNKYFDIICVTCIGRGNEIHNHRLQNLKEIYGDIFLSVHCINFGESKEDTLRYLRNRHNVVSYIDDNLKHIQESLNVGIKPILFQRGYAGKIKNDLYDVYDCWNDMYNHLIRLK